MIVLNVDCYTPQNKILELRARMRDFLVRESKEFLPDMEIQIQEMDVKLKISMVIEHKGNWQDSGRRWSRRTKVSRQRFKETKKKVNAFTAGWLY